MAGTPERALRFLTTFGMTVAPVGYHANSCIVVSATVLPCAEDRNPRRYVDARYKDAGLGPGGSGCSAVSRLSDLVECCRGRHQPGSGVAQGHRILRDRLVPDRSRYRARHLPIDLDERKLPVDRVLQRRNGPYRGRKRFSRGRGGAALLELRHAQLRALEALCRAGRRSGQVYKLVELRGRRPFDRQRRTLIGADRYLELFRGPERWVEGTEVDADLD